MLTALSLLLSITVPAHAQSRKVIYLQSYEKAPYHFGFLLGLNFMGYSIKTIDNYQNQVFDDYSWLPRPLPVNSTDAGEFDLHGFVQKSVDHFEILRVESNPLWENLGFSVGGSVDLRLANYFNLRVCPTLSLGSREIRYYLHLYDQNNQLILIEGEGTTLHKTHSKDILATYAELPIHLKYRSHRYNNIGAYLLAGINPKFLLYSRGPKTAEDEEGSGNQLKFLLPKRADVALEFGAGYDIYNQWFKMGVEIKASLGMVNLLRDETAYREFLYQAPIKSLRNKQLQISFTFE